MSDMGQPRPQVYTLSNGMTYVRHHMPGAEGVQVQIIVRAGSRDETPATAGYAHCLEHFLFKGAEDYPTAWDINNTIEQLGGSSNAFTSIEMVSYYTSGLAEDVRQLAKVITRMVTRPTFPPAQWAPERGTVLDELANAAATPAHWMWDTLFTTAFGGGQPISWSAGGIASVVAAAEVPALVDYYNNFYDPAKMAIVISGGDTLEPEEVEALVASMPHGSNPPRQQALWGQGPPFVGKAVDKAMGNQVRMLLAVPGLAIGKDERGEIDELAMDLLGALMTGGDSARLSTIVRRQPSVVSGFELEHFAMQDTGMFMVNAMTTPAMQERTVRIVVEELGKLAATPPTADEVQQATIGAITNLYRATEDAEGTTSYLAQRWAQGRELLLPAELAERYRAVDAAAIQRAAQRVVAGLNDVRFTFVHPSDPATGRNAVGQTVDEAGQAIRAAAMAPPTPQLDRGVA